MSETLGAQGLERTDLEQLASRLPLKKKVPFATLISLTFFVCLEAAVRVADPGATKKALLASLLHDAPEYVIGDMISPFKAVIGLDYRRVEARLLRSVHVRFMLAL